MAKITRCDGESVRRAIGSKNTAILHALVYAPPRLRHALIQHANKDLIRCICECALNLLHGNVTVSESEKSKLRKYKKILRKLVDKKENLGGKKKIINQKGGSFLPLLLGPIVSAIISSIT